MELIFVDSDFSDNANRVDYDEMLFNSLPNLKLPTHVSLICIYVIRYSFLIQNVACIGIIYNF